MSDSGRVMGDCRHGLGENTCIVCLKETITAQRNKISRLEIDIQGREKAWQLMNKGMESLCERNDALKQKVREYEQKFQEMWGIVCPDCGPEEYEKILEAVMVELQR